jgi:hypothetical protein
MVHDGPAQLMTTSTYSVLLDSTRNPFFWPSEISSIEHTMSSTSDVPQSYKLGAVNVRTDRYLQMNRLSLRNNRFRFKTSGKTTDHFRGIYGIVPQINKDKPKHHNM